ncbi:CDP-alcohol phosphatidyltransferase family protein [Phyllobacterium zundukense]|uniref:CDP-alcohol phosphatidyltransferase family protein n=1 Tax=Phyllobacterium zundukense TaxID=1867719 RepID=A0ACD4D443_9HYPH|nr:CDP-alcohol phosphatidyltransferase family protein [Phyllobacterium zundukense]UXN60579.1 CDP-alcohol phosphatidyltransferase family protein [Phyllobacterium zundukense]
MTIPNYITIFRFILVPFIVMALLSGYVGAALIGFVIAGISDGIDGFIARRYNQGSELGAYLDPIADKLLLVSLFVVLGFVKELPVWLVVIVVSRDIFIIGAVLLGAVIGKPLEMHPLFVSKANTAFQIILVTVTLADIAFDFSLAGVRMVLVWIVALLTAASAAAYLMAWTKHMAGYEQEHKQD